MTSWQGPEPRQPDPSPNAAPGPGFPAFGAPPTAPPQYGAPQYGPPPQYGAPQYGAPQYGPLPGRHGFGYPQTYSTPLRPTNSVSGLAIAITCVMGLQMLFMVLATAAFGERLSLLNRLRQDPSSVTLLQLTQSDSFVRGTQVLFAVGLIALATLLVIWFWQARTNAAVYAPDRMGLARGWAIGGWFVPLASMVLPYLVARDIHRGTTSGLPDRKESVGVATRVWWGFWVLSNLLFVIMDFQANNGDYSNDSVVYTRDLHDAAKTAVLAFPLGIIAGAVLLVFLWQVTRLQRRRNAALMGMAGFGGMPGGYGYGFAAPGMPGPVPPGYGYPGMPGQPMAPGYGPPEMYQGMPAGMPPVPGMPQGMQPGMQQAPTGGPVAGAWPQQPPAMPTPMPAPMPMPTPMAAPVNPPTLVDRAPEGWAPVADPPTMVDRVPEMRTTAVPRADAPAARDSAVRDSAVTQAVPIRAAVTDASQGSAAQGSGAQSGAAPDAMATQAVPLYSGKQDSAPTEAVPIATVQDAIPAGFRSEVPTPAADDPVDSAGSDSVSGPATTESAEPEQPAAPTPTAAPELPEPPGFTLPQ